MLTKVQKIIMYLSGALSIVLGIFTFIPFRAVPFFAAEESTIITEVILKSIPKVGNELSQIPVLIQMVKCHITKEYTLTPISSLITIVAALIYLASAIDIIPDTIPGIGHVDDTAVVAACVAVIKIDLDNFIAWRDSRKA